MLFLKDAFTCYSSEVTIKALESPSFAGGVVGLTTEDLKYSNGLGATALKKLAEIFNIPSDVPVIGYMVSEDLELEYVITPTFKLNKDNILGFAMGDFFATIDQCYDAVEAISSADLAPEILKINGDDKRLVAAFTFDFTPEKKEKGGRVEKVEYSFAVGQNRKEEDAGLHLVGLFEKHPQLDELIGALQSSPYIAKQGTGYAIPLKKLPLGIYYISSIDRVEESLKKKDGTPFSKSGWSFEAKNASTGASFLVECADSSFIGQHIKNSGKVALNKTAITSLNEADAPPLLKIAAVGKPGRAILVLSDMKKAGTGLSPQGSVVVRETDELTVQTANQLMARQLAKINARAEALRKELAGSSDAVTITTTAVPALNQLPGNEEDDWF